VSEQRLVIKRKVGDGDPPRAADLLVADTGLSRRAIKDAMSKGAVWIRRGRGRRRVRRATAIARPGDRVELFYDPALLAVEPPAAALVLDRRRFSVWLKPAGLLAQGSDFGDHCSLPRQVERDTGRRVHLVHRLDRETAGVMLLAHDPEAAARLSALFRDGAVVKRYRALVLGAPGSPGQVLTVDRPVDGRTARTDLRVVAVASAGSRVESEVEITLHTGRTHQIRRHLSGIGHPVIGDPRYGRGNKNRQGLCLAAYAIELRCPVTGDALRAALDPSDLLPRAHRGGS
jgi:tRNA pseudouridine32 synthase/23S rRNA pseudouridine746 synthase